MQVGIIKRNIMVLSISNLIIGLIEFVFNMYLARVLGAEGLGLLSLIAPINCLFLSFMTEGVVITMSKTSAANASKEALGKLSSIIKITTAASFLWALFLCLVLIIAAPLIATYFLGDCSLVHPIRATCPLMLLMSISNILKGHFLGLSKIKIPALINIGEKLLRFPILYFLIEIFLNKGFFPPVTMVFLCYAIGEMQSVLLLLIYYRITPHENIAWRSLYGSIKSTLMPIIKASIPICLTQCLLELVNALSQVVVKLRLMSAGFTLSQSLNLLGKYKGMVFPLMSYPMILVGATCAIVIPRISILGRGGTPHSIKRLVHRTLYLAFAIGWIAFLICFFFADSMGMFFYGRSDLDTMIIIGGLCCPIIYCSAASTSLLIGLGMEKLSFRNSLIQQCLLLLCLLIFTGISKLNIYGYFLSIFITNFMLLMGNLPYLKRVYCNPTRPIV